MTDDPALAELLTLWPRLSDDARQSLLRIARAKVGARVMARGIRRVALAFLIAWCIMATGRAMRVPTWRPPYGQAVTLSVPGGRVVGPEWQDASGQLWIDARQMRFVPDPKP